MPAIANIIASDAETTPINHTFVPKKVEGDTARWLEKTAATPMGWWSLDMTLRAPVNGSQVYKHTLNLAIPKLKSFTDPNGNPIVVVDYVHRYKLEGLHPVNGLLQDRKNIRKVFVDILGLTQTKSQIEDLENVW